MNQRNRKKVLVVICVLAASICYSCGSTDVRTQAALETEGISLTSQVLDVQETERECFYVHICGEVKVPGVYEVQEGSRIFEVIELAGGFTDEAAVDYLNMAQPVTDGMKLKVPAVGETAENGGFEGETDHKVNLNTADKEELMTLKGIGEARAEDILKYREQHGAFRAVEDIMKVPGIKDAAFQKIKDDIAV